MIVTDAGNMVTEYGQRYNIEICTEMFGIFMEDKDTDICIKLSDTVKSLTKGNEWTYRILYTGCIAAASVCILIIQKDASYFFDPHSRDIYGRPIDGDTFILLCF